MTDKSDSDIPHNSSGSDIMADVHPTKVRSYNMSQIKSGGTKPEELGQKVFIFPRVQVQKKLCPLARKTRYCLA